MPSTPPDAKAVASCSARAIAAFRLPPQRHDVGSGNKCTTPIIGFGVLNIWFKSTGFQFGPYNKINYLEYRSGWICSRKTSPTLSAKFSIISEARRACAALFPYPQKFSLQILTEKGFLCRCAGEQVRTYIQIPLAPLCPPALHGP